MEMGLNSSVSDMGCRCAKWQLNSLRHNTHSSCSCLIWRSWNQFLTTFFLIYLFILFLFEKQGYRKKRKKQIFICHLTPQTAAVAWAGPGLDSVEAGGRDYLQIWHICVILTRVAGLEPLGHRAILCCFLSCTSRELGKAEQLELEPTFQYRKLVLWAIT